MTTLSYFYREDPIDTHHITPLDFDSIVEVPESHQWFQSDEQQPHQNIHDPKDSWVPVIDLTDPHAIELIGEACEKWGIFQVVNHGVPAELVKEVEFETHRLFGLPTQEKCKVLRPPSEVTGYGLARIARFFDKCMWHEAFTIIGSCVDHAKVLWPHSYQTFSDAMDAYQYQMKLLADKLILLIHQALHGTEQEMNWVTSIHNSQGAIQLNSYPSCPDPSRVMGFAPHTDSLLLTLLHQSNIGGLEVFVEGLGWSPVRPVEGAFVVNIADLLHIFTNATYPVVNHRAMVNKSKQRISVAYFYGPSTESVVAPSTKFQDPCFRSLPMKEYLSLKNKHFDKALSLIRK